MRIKIDKDSIIRAIIEKLQGETICFSIPPARNTDISDTRDRPPVLLRVRK